MTARCWGLEEKGQDQKQSFCIVTSHLLFDSSVELFPKSYLSFLHIPFVSFEDLHSHSSGMFSLNMFYTPTHILFLLILVSGLLRV